MTEDFTDRPASHAVAHAEDRRCPCHDKTEAEIATPYALAAFGFCALAVLAVVVVAVIEAVYG